MSTAMSSNENKAIGHRWVDAMNSHDLDAAGRFLTDDFVSHFPGAPGPVQGVEAWKQLVGVFFTAFPDMRIEIHDEVAEGDRVAARYTMSGTHRGEFNGIPPTGRRISVGGVGLFRMAGGRIAEEWPQDDLLGLMQQLGAIPRPESAPA